MSLVASSVSVLAVVVMLIVCQYYCSAQCTPPNGLAIPGILTYPPVIFNNGRFSLIVLLFVIFCDGN